MTVVAPSRGGRVHGRAASLVRVDVSLAAIPQAPSRVTTEQRSERGKLGRREGRVAKAVEFLEDGTTYREAAASARTDEKRLKADHPEYEANWSEWNRVLASIKGDDRLLELHREIWQQSKYNKV